MKKFGYVFRITVIYVMYEKASKVLVELQSLAKLNADKGVQVLMSGGGCLKKVNSAISFRRPARGWIGPIQDLE